MIKENIKPVFKYIGGKSWLRDELRNSIRKCLVNNQLFTYAEPFVGGLGSFLAIYDILLEHKIKNVILSDINQTLINTYIYIQNQPKALTNEFLAIEKQFVHLINSNWRSIHNKTELKDCLRDAEQFFNRVKKEFNINRANFDITQSARLIFLQKHSFNGIYRENSKGEYNTPFNWSGHNMLNSIAHKINEMSALFNQFNIQFIAQSFEELDYNQNTLYYLDPPYLNDNITENKYVKGAFNIEKQLLLIQKIKNVKFIYSNHKSDILLEEFNKIHNLTVKELLRKNTISPNSESRKIPKIEILVTKI